MLEWLRIAGMIVILGCLAAATGTYLVTEYRGHNLYWPVPSRGYPDKPNEAASQQAASNPQDHERGSLERPIMVQSVLTKEEAQQQADDRAEKSTNDGRLTALNFMLVLVTVGLVGYTAVLSNATKRLVRGAEDTAERQLRAYIFVENAWIKSDTDTKTWRAVYRIKNFGATPAAKVIIRDAAEATAQSATQTPSLGHAISYGSLAPHSDFIDCESRPINDVTAEELRWELKTIILAGRITYMDSFGRDRSTDFCFVATGEPTSDGEMDVSEYGNDHT
jgi:hypothetical protein